MINIQPVEKRVIGDGSNLEVHSIFYTIQGEGPYAGHPAVFIRLAGCNLQCPGCDTDYTKLRTIGTPESIYQECMAYFHYMKNPLVVITGGEPFRQNISRLTWTLQDLGFHVQIETNGTLSPSPNFPIGVIVVCSPKAGKVNQDLLPYISAYKYVLSHDCIDAADGLPTLALYHSASPRVARPHEGFNGPVFVQPMDPTGGQIDIPSFAQAQYEQNVKAVKETCLKFGYILQLQIHKLIGVE